MTFSESSEEKTALQHLEALLDLPGDGRQAYLADLDAAVSLEVQRLLRAHERMEDSFLATSVLENSAFAGVREARDAVGGQLVGNLVSDSHEISAVSAPEDRLLGTELGAYRLVRLIDHGGMGSVFLAERVDRRFERQVAIKILPRHLDAALAARFDAERRILARLNHPNIAQLYDGGETPDGLPYLVMEYVRGLPIDQYCTTHGLGVESILRLFSDVLEAVRFAHQNLVVHRDLKPTNILITEDGSVKLLDFGVARLTGAERVGPSESQTSHYLTPAYASPEELQGEIESVVSDIYSLGVVLFRLLTGGYPHPDTVRMPFSELKKVVCESDPVAPSKVASGGHAGVRVASHRLVGDLDAIVLKALHRQGQFRYQSTERFAADIHRFLARRPVSARRATMRYRTRRFVQRNAAMVVAAVIAFVLAAGSVITIVHQRNVAITERDAAEDLHEFVLGLFEVYDPESGADTELTAAEFLDHGERTASQLLLRDVGDYVDVVILLATLRTKLGYYSAALETLGNLDSLQNQMTGDQSSELLLLQGRLHMYLGQYSQSDSLLRSAVERSSTSDREFVVRSTLAHARLMLRRDSLDAADILARRAQDVVQKLPDDSPLRPVVLAFRARTISETGQFYHASELFVEALKVNGLTSGPGSLSSAGIMNDYANCLVQMNRSSEALDTMREALQIQIDHFGRDHASVATSLNNLGLILLEVGRTEEAIELLGEATAIRSRRLGTANPRTASSVHNLAAAYRAAGRLVRAESLYTVALGLLEASVGQKHSHLARTWASLGLTLRQQEKWSTAAEAYQHAVSIYRFSMPRMAIELSVALNGLGKVQYSQGDFVKAVASFSECLSLREGHLDSDHWRVGTAHSLLGQAQLALGDSIEALGNLKYGLEILENALGPDHARTLAARDRLPTSDRSLDLFRK